MALFGLALVILAAGGIAALLASARPRLASRLGAGGAVVGGALGLVPAAAVLAGADLAPVELPWSVPGGSLSLAIDPLSAFFLAPIFAIGAATSVYGAAYLAPDARGGRLGPAWLWLDLLIASMAVVATSTNGVLFLFAWEVMALASFFLVVFHHERPEVPRAGWVYLVATHLGTAFLLAAFAWLARDAGSFDFADWRAPASGAAWLFALALVGFGSKAGLFPLHVWLPEAHPAAPSHVSALLSGVMVKLGVYGLLRMLVILGEPAPAWGALLLGAGLASAGFGAVAALAQRDLKRWLAYSTVENVGIVAIGLGLGALAASRGDAAPAALAFAGGLLHVWSHSLFKSLLFVSAGSLARGAGTLDVERLGGLLRRMPWTGAALLAGAAAACALPPWNGFVGELLVYLAAFHAVGSAGTLLAPALAAIVGLCFAGAVAAAGCVRALGIALLGEPRSEGASEAREVARPLRAIGVALSGACLVAGVAGAAMLLAALRPVAQLAGGDAAAAHALAGVVPVLWKVGAGGAVFAAGSVLLVWLRRRLLPAPAASDLPTWDCGYAEPGPRMQYTASSFGEPLTRLFAGVLRIRTSERGPDTVLPARGVFASQPADAADGVYAHAFAGVEALALRLHPLQAGSTQRYVLYTVLAALGLLVWRLA
jgi:formate hydrogenlyase subunit 3/multisubunit Na+/H+ antiporter MnhD subunit